MRKNIKKFSVMMLVLGMSLTANAQTTWDLGGNSNPTPNEIGTSSPTDFKFITDGQFRMSLTQQGRLGLGIDQPRAWQEISYCPSPGQSESGLIVTLNKCFSNQPLFDFSMYDVIGTGTVGPITGNEGSGTFKAPLSFLTGNITNFGFPTFNNKSPLFWVRQEHPSGVAVNSNSGQPEYETNFIVMPDGSCGINIAAPRASLDVRGSNRYNYPAAIIGARAFGYQPQNGQGLAQYHTQQVQFIPRLRANGYNQITQQGDQGMFFTDGKGVTATNEKDGSNLNGSFVLAPWASQGNPAIGGMRMDAMGNTEFHGTLRATKVNVDAKWWSDFVFEDDYKLLNLAEVEAFISTNKHLPNVPSEAEVLENGIDVANMQAIQQQKIEELTLYIIQLKREMDAMKVEMELLKQ